MEKCVYKKNMGVIVLKGRYAGKKAFIQLFNKKSAECNYETAVIVGIEKGPKKAYVGMTEEEIKKRSRIRPFIKKINLGHILPTKYVIDLDLEKNEDIFSGIKKWNEKNYSLRRETEKKVKKILEKDYYEGKNRWLYERILL